MLRGADAGKGFVNRCTDLARLASAGVVGGLEAVVSRPYQGRKTGTQYWDVHVNQLLLVALPRLEEFLEHPAVTGAT